VGDGPVIPEPNKSQFWHAMIRVWFQGILDTVFSLFPVLVEGLGSKRKQIVPSQNLRIRKCMAKVPGRSLKMQKKRRK